MRPAKGWSRLFSRVKRVAFWLGATASTAVSAFGALILLALVAMLLVADDKRQGLAELWEITTYFGSAGLKVAGEPELLVGTLFWIVLYVAAMFLLAQTEREKRVCRWLVPSTLLGLPLCVMFGFTLALGALASQGAGQ